MAKRPMVTVSVPRGKKAVHRRAADTQPAGGFLNGKKYSLVKVIERLTTISFLVVECSDY